MQLPSETLKENLALFPESTVISRNKQWFKNIYEKHKEKPFEKNISMVLEIGKMYTFMYDAKYKNELEFWDYMPHSICIGHQLTQSGELRFLCINISYIPPKYRYAILDKIVKIFNTSVINKNIEKIQKGNLHTLKELPLYYDICKKILHKSGFEFAIRSYIPERIYSKPMIISYPDWWRIMSFPSKYILKLNIRAIYVMYKKNISTTYKVGDKEDEVKLERTKIKDRNKYLKDRNT